MKIGDHVKIRSRIAEVIQIKWNLIKVKFLDDDLICWFHPSESEPVEK